jgi:hypothetical protein
MGRQILQRERQRLARENAQQGAVLVNEVRAAQDLREVQALRPVTNDTVGVSRGIVRRVAAVLASEDVHAPINVRPVVAKGQMRAWTDFNQIDVTYVNHEDKRLLAATLRGLLYHEGGHCRWTVPLDVLGEMAGVPKHTALDYKRAWNCLEDQRMETAVVSDSPRKAAYFTPMIMTELTQTLDMAAANYPLLVWRRYLPTRLRDQARRLFITVHGAEGQHLVDMLDEVVTRYVMATEAKVMWQAVLDFDALLQAMRPLAADMTSAGHQQQTHRGWQDNNTWDEGALSIPVDPSMLPDESPEPAADDDHVGERDDDEPEQPLTLDDLDEDEVQHVMDILAASMLSAETLVTIQYVLPPDESSQDEPQDGAGDLGDEDSDPAPQGEQGDDDDNADDQADGSGHGDTSGRPDAEDHEAGGSKDQDDQDGQEDSDEVGGSTGAHGEDDDTTGADDEADEDGDWDDMDQDELDGLLQAAEDERLGQDEDLNGDLRAFDQATRDRTSALDTYVGGISGDAVAQMRAQMLAEDIERSFHTSTMDRAPGWVEGQRRGNLNVLRYETRQPGDAEIFRQWTDDDQPGYDISVSVLLDYSSSMSGEVAELAECGYASKVACDSLGIPCTVLLWDTDARVLWDANERAEALPTISAVGGTDPSTALADLDNHRCNRPKHVVLLMTDGVWNDEWETGPRQSRPTRHLGAYKTGDRYIVGFGMASNGNQGQHLRASLMRKGCDEAFGITNLMDIPQHLERILLNIA